MIIKTLFRDTELSVFGNSVFIFFAHKSNKHSGELLTYDVESAKISTRTNVRILEAIICKRTR